jgi:hypothetical protein
MLLLVFPHPAGAVCDGMSYDGSRPIDVPDAVIFVGTVVDTQSIQQNGLLRVEEIWQGGPLPEWQQVYGTTERNMIISTNTHFEVGQPYLVVATRNGSLLMNHGCRTNRYSDVLAARAPEDATGPTPATRPGSWGHPEPWPWDLVLWPLTAAIVIAGGWGALWLRRNSADLRP